MLGNDKFIDGLSRRRNTQRRSVAVASKMPKIDNMPPRRRQIGLDLTKSNFVPIMRKRSEKKPKRDEKQLMEDFVSPVEGLKWDKVLEEEKEVSEVKQEEQMTESPLEIDFEINEEELLKGRGKKNRKARPRKKRRKIGFVIFLLIVLTGLGVAYFWGDGIVAKMTSGKSGLFDAIRSAIIDDKTPLKKDSGGRTNILAFGTSGYDMGGSGHDGASLTDSIMVISLDQETKDVALINLPRDLKVRGACMAGKINEIYTCNNSQGTDESDGARGLARVVGEILGIEIHYHAHMNWGALVKIVDLVGGITVTLDEDIMEGNTYTKTNIRAGVPTELGGEQALGLARARHGSFGGDFSRGASQQKILMAIGDKITKKNLGPKETLELVNTLGDNLRTDFSIEEMKTLAKLLKDFKLENIRQAPLTGLKDGDLVRTGTLNNISYVFPVAGIDNYIEIQKYTKKMFSSDPTVREKAKIIVLNGTEEAGLAGREQKKLEDQGLDVSKIGNAPKGSYPQKYLLYDLTKKNSGTRKLLEEKYQVKAKEDLEALEGVDLTRVDFVIILGEEN